MRCAKCHRPLKVASSSGLGPVCAKRFPAAPVHERDLFGFDVEKACHAAIHRIGILIESAAADARAAVRQAFRDARVRAGVWRA